MKPLKIGVVTARFNSDVTDMLEQGALDVLEAVPVEIFTVKVPGAFEIPLACKTLLEAGCDGVVALGAVIRGETTHYDYVCNSVERGITQVMLDLGKPIAFGILTTENEEQAFDRVGGKHGHKGTEAAQVVLEMVGLIPELKKINQLKKKADSNYEKSQPKKKVSPQRKTKQRKTKK